MNEPLDPLILLAIIYDLQKTIMQLRRDNELLQRAVVDANKAEEVSEL